MLGPFAESANRISPTLRSKESRFIPVSFKATPPLKSGYRKHLVDHSASVRKLLILDVVRIDRRGVDTTDPLYGSIEMIERMLLNKGRDLGRDPIKRLGLIDKNRSVRFHDRFKDGLLVERSDGAEVHDPADIL